MKKIMAFALTAVMTLALLVGWILLDVILNIFPERYVSWAVGGAALLGWGTSLAWVFLVKFLLTAQHGQRIFDLCNEGGVLHRPAGHMTAAQHQLALVHLGQAVLVGVNGLDEGAVRVIRQHHDMGRFQRSAGAHLHALSDRCRIVCECSLLCSSLH